MDEATLDDVEREIFAGAKLVWSDSPIVEKREPQDPSMELRPAIDPTSPARL